MELGFVVVLIASALAGLACRTRLRPRAGRRLLLLGVMAASVGLLILAGAVLAWAPLRALSAGLLSALFLLLAAAILPFALIVSMGRR